jgi:hypothetical protein
MERSQKIGLIFADERQCEEKKNCFKGAGVSFSGTVPFLAHPLGKSIKQGNNKAPNEKKKKKKSKLSWLSIGLKKNENIY